MRVRALLRDFLREIGAFLGWYALILLAGLGWLLAGSYFYLLPVPPSTPLSADFNQNIGISLVAQGFVFTITSVVVLLGRLALGSREKEAAQKEEARKDREMLRELHQWMQEQKNKQENNVPASAPATVIVHSSPDISRLDADAVIPPIDPAMLNAHDAQSDGKTARLN